MKAKTINTPGYIFVLLLMLSVAGCTSTAKKVFDEKTYTLGGTVTGSEGSLIASELHGTAETTRSWVGIMNSDDGWGPGRLEFSDDYLERKLFYLGYEEPYLHFMYREYKKGEPRASVNQMEKFDANESPFIQVNDFYLEALSLEGTQVKFNMLNKELFDTKKTEFAVSKKKQEEQDELDNAIKTVNLARKKAWAAKQSAEQLTQITSMPDSFSQKINEFDALNTAFDEVGKQKYSVSQSIGTYQTYEKQFSQFAAFFTPVATAVKAWSAMDNDFKNAVNSGAEKDYFKMALELKTAGERDLQEERYEQATEQFSEAQEEISRIIDHLQNRTSE